MVVDKPVVDEEVVAKRLPLAHVTTASSTVMMVIRVPAVISCGMPIRPPQQSTVQNKLSQSTISLVVANRTYDIKGCIK